MICTTSHSLYRPIMLQLLFIAVQIRKMANYRWIRCVLAFALAIPLVSTQPIELDDSFLATRGDSPWLIEFYAPWCGHCRKLEPTYHQVYLTLRQQSSPVRVAKIDATRYSGVSSEFDVRGFPTIKFIMGEKKFTHRGDRSRESIIEFAKRALGPTVRPIRNVGKFSDVRGDHADQVFFMFIGDQDGFGELATKYAAVAEKYAVLSYFYSGERRVLPSDMKLQFDPTVVVFKDSTSYEFIPPKDGLTKKNLDAFVNGERFTIFPKMTGGGLNEMADIHKKIVIIVTDEKDKKTKTKQERFKDVAYQLITQQRDRLHKYYQFMWMGETETADSITMSTMTSPSLLVLEPDSQYYYFPPFPLNETTTNNLADFLQDVIDGKIQAYGGTGILQRIKRLFYDIFTTVYSLYETSGWLALLVFGVPILVISVVCYALCCMEPFDDTIFEREGEEEEEGEKKALTEGDDGTVDPDEGMEKTEELKKKE